MAFRLTGLWDVISRNIVSTLELQHGEFIGMGGSAIILKDDVREWCVANRVPYRLTSGLEDGYGYVEIHIDDEAARIKFALRWV